MKKILLPALVLFLLSLWAYSNWILIDGRYELLLPNLYQCLNFKYVSFEACKWSKEYDVLEKNRDIVADIENTCWNYENPLNTCDCDEYVGVLYNFCRENKTKFQETVEYKQAILERKQKELEEQQKILEENQKNIEENRIIESQIDYDAVISAQKYLWEKKAKNFDYVVSIIKTKEAYIENAEKLIKIFKSSTDEYTKNAWIYLEYLMSK